MDCGTEGNNIRGPRVKAKTEEEATEMLIEDNIETIRENVTDVELVDVTEESNIVEDEDEVEEVE